MDDLKDTAGNGILPDEAERQLMVRLGMVERELRALRGKNRVLTWGILLAILVALVPFLAPGLPAAIGVGGTGTIEATEFTLVDPNGGTRGTWAVDDNGNGVMALMDPQGRARLTLTVRAAGFPGISLSNSSGERLATMGVLNDAAANMVFADGLGTPRVVLGLSEGNTGGLVVADAAGSIQIGFDVNSQGVSGMILPDMDDDGN